VTQPIAETTNKIDKLLKELEENVKDASPSFRAAAKSDIAELKAKLKANLHRLDESVKPGKSVHYESADNIINKYVLWASGVGLVPLPGVDLVGIAGVQGKMIHELCKLYGLGGFSDRAVTNTLTAVIGSFGPGVLMSGAVGSLLKSIPLVGSVAGAAALSVVGGTSTYVVGKLVQEHFELGGTPDNFRVDREQAQKLSKEAPNLGAQETKQPEMVVTA
jgi:uncharacterized protein (DUF697 family)